MTMSPARWKEITPSQFPWEREALEYIRKGLPGHEPYRAWSNFEFIAHDGPVTSPETPAPGYGAPQQAKSSPMTIRFCWPIANLRNLSA